MYVSTTFQPSVAEITRGNKLARRTTRAVVWVVGACYFAVGVAVCVATGVLNWVPDWYATGAASCFVGIFQGYRLVTAQKRAVFKAAYALCRPTNVTITDDAYRSETELAKREYKWPIFVKFVDASEFFLLFLMTRELVVLPKRVLDDAQVAELSAFLAERKPSRQALLTP